jgi:twinkle protein
LTPRRSKNKVIRKEQCPRCASEGRDTSEDNLAVYDDGHSHCYACDYHIGGKEEFNPLPDNTFTYEYLAHRGIEKETFRFYDTLTKIDPEGKPVSVGFKYPDGSYKIRSLAKKTFEWSPGGDKAKTGLFGRDKFSAGSHKHVVITEGEYDAQSLYQLLRCPCVSVHSSVTAVRDCSVDLDWLRSFDRVYLAFDGDEQGREAARKCAALFDYHRLYVLKFTKHKDANAYLQAGEDDELKQIFLNARKYLPDVIKSSTSEFRDILKEAPKFGVPYPFPTLTEMTYGIRKGESVLITAQEKVGKTELMHAIEHKLLKDTDDNVGAIYLEEPIRRHLQALAGLEIGRPVHLPDCGVDQDQVADALQKVVRVDDRLHVYSHFGSDDPDVLLDTIRFLVVSRKCGFILLDHISMAVSGRSDDDERRSIDYLCTRLQMMVKELGFSLIFVSHLNDNGQTRGSRYPGKICDVRIDITRDMQDPDPVIRNTMHVTVAYNRYSGKSGPAGDLLFDPATYTLKEIANDNFSPPAIANRVEKLVA